MINEPRKIALTGLFIAAVAIAVCVSQLGRGWLSLDEPGVERDDAAAYSARSDTTTGPVTARSAAIPYDSTAIAGQTYAVRNSLQDDDVTTAQSQPEAARAASQSEDQALASPGIEPAQVAQMQAAPAATQTDRVTQQAPKSARTSSPASGKSGRAYGPRATPRETSNSAYTHAKNQRSFESALAPGSAASTSSGKTETAGAPVFAGPPDPAPADIKPPAQPVSALPSGPPSELVARASATSSPVVPQPGASGGTLLKPEGGAKTRAQVRAEIAQARADGSLPAFGNPDPAGPGGAPNLTLLPRP